MENIAITTKNMLGVTIYDDGDVRISEDFFWKAVEIINWKWLSQNIHSVDKDIFKYKLLKKYKLNIWKEVQEIHIRKYQALREMLRSYDNDWRVGTGDDGTWDLCSHVVGLGRESFLESFKNPEILIEIGSNRNYRENFGYWIPIDEKYDLPNSLDFIEKEN